MQMKYKFLDNNVFYINPKHFMKKLKEETRVAWNSAPKDWIMQTE